ncbi:putative LRR receptor-like protein kinase [Trifolium pratense]|nr:putative LRR receptor-like protein kinase [Trifolium pratense]
MLGVSSKAILPISMSSFQGNCLQINDLNQRPSIQCGGASPAKSQPVRDNQFHQIVDHVRKRHRSSKPTWLLALEIVAGTMVGSLFLIAALAALQRCNNKSSIIIPWKKSASLSHYSIYSNVIGSSPDSVVYKGTMKGGPEIAVISLFVKEEHWTGYLELFFQREVAELARLNHENTGKLLGYCKESNMFLRMLVFDYASNGTLHEHLHCLLNTELKILLYIKRLLNTLKIIMPDPFKECSSSVFTQFDYIISEAVMTPVPKATTLTLQQRLQRCGSVIELLSEVCSDEDVNVAGRVGQRSFSMWQAWFEARQMQQSISSPVNRSTVRWEKPLEGWIKCNVDAAIYTGVALLESIKLAVQRGYDRVVFESDSQTLVNSIYARH